MQLHHVRGMRWEGEPGGYGPRRGEDRWDRWRNPYGQGGSGSWGDGRGTPCPDMVAPSWAHNEKMSSSATAFLPQLLQQLQAGGVGAHDIAQIRRQAQSGQLNGVLSEVAK